MASVKFKDWLLDVIFPKFCLDCGKEGFWICPQCRSRMLFRAPSCPVCRRRNFDGILCPTCSEKSGLRRFLAPFSYRDELVRDLVHAYKYEGIRELKVLFAEEILRMLNFYGIAPPLSSLLVPMPLHRSRERERGFNQARLLAEEIGLRLNLEVAGLLRRARKTEQQIEMKDYEARRANVAGAFEARDAAARLKARGRAVILIDDVSTSGATLFEAARVLREAGARTVWAIVVAKS